MAIQCGKIWKDLAAFVDSRQDLQLPDLSETESSKAAVTKILGDVVGTVGGLVMAGLHAMLPTEWKKGKSYSKKLKKDTEFSEACGIILDLLEEVDDELFGAFLEQGMITYMKGQLLNRKVITSFYGDNNVGKSTLLNSIMGDSYLPISRQVETAVPVHIKFLKPTASAISITSPENSAPLCDALYKWETREVVAVGTNNIKKALEEINKTSRANDTPSESDTLLLELNHPFTSVTLEGPDFYMMDNPGCDEFGSSVIQMSIKTAQDVSSCFIFVTTIDNYRNEKFSLSLKDTYNKNPEIVKNNRITIVINKIDQALCDRVNESSFTKEDVVSIVHGYICNKVFCCSPEVFPKQCVIPVCSTWALYSRQFRNNSKLKNTVIKELGNIHSIDEFSGDERLKNIEGNDDSSNADILEEYSNISEVERRITAIAEKPIFIWKQKMTSDIQDHSQILLNKLRNEISSFEQNASVQCKRIEEMHSVLLLCKDLYKKIYDEGKSSKGVSKLRLKPETWLDLKQAAKMDMEKPENIRSLILSSVEESLENFKASTSLKILNKKYTSDLLEKDLEQLLKNLSLKINRLLTSRDSFSKLSEVYYKKSTDIHSETIQLKYRLFNVLKKTDSTAHRKSGLQISYPKLIGPIFVIFLDIPLQLSLLRRLLNIIRSLLKMSPTGSFFFSAIVNMESDDDVSCKDLKVNEESAESQPEDNSSTSDLVTQNQLELAEIKYMGPSDVASVAIVTSDVASVDIVTSDVADANHEISIAANADVAPSELAKVNVETSDGVSSSARNTEILDTKYGDPVNYQDDNSQRSSSSETTCEHQLGEEPQYSHSHLSDKDSDNDTTDDNSSSVTSQDSNTYNLPEEDNSNGAKRNSYDESDQQCVVIVDISEQSKEEQNIGSDVSEDTSNDLSSTNASSASTSEKQMKAFYSISKETSSTIKEKGVYKEWTEGLDKVKEDIKVGIKKEIETFFKDLDGNVVLKFYQHYHDVASNTLKEFDSSMMEDIEVCMTMLKTTMVIYEEEQKKLEVLRKHEKKLTKRMEVFRLISSNPCKIKKMEHAV